MDDTQKRTWAEADLGRLTHNYQALRGLTPQGCRFLGVVKADAYGHGAVPVAKKLVELGAEYLAVACLDEARELRAAGIEKTPLLLLGLTPTEFTDELLELNLTQTVGDRAEAEAYSKAAEAAGKRLTVHIKVDTGMSRLGFLCRPETESQAAEEIASVCALPGLRAEGIYTHFSDADGSEAYTMLQFTRFLDLLDRLGELGVGFEIRHCAASAAVLNYPCTHLDMIRPGIALYGHFPAEGMEELCPLLPVMGLKTRISAVRQVPADTPVSYGRTHVLQRDSRLAVLPVGYADGFFRLFSDRLTVSVGGAVAPLIGRVCMDMCMIDVTDLPAVCVGDTVTLYGDDAPVERGAGLVGTIQYELLCAVAGRVPRIYL